MPRIRTIKPEFWTSEQVIELSMPARLLFIGMWNFCDDRGVMPAAVKSLKAKVLPADDCTIGEVQGWVDEMKALELVIEFEAESKRWWYITGWKHQVINRPTPSKFPEPPLGKPEPLPSDDDALNDDSSPRGPSRSTAGDTARGPSRSTAADEPESQDEATVDDDSLSAHGGLTEDSSQERKGKERRGEEEERERASEPKPPRQRREQARGARLSLTELPHEWREFADHEQPGIDADAVWAVFRDYWIAQPGQRGVKTDWPATWRNWVRREQPKRVNGHGQHAAHQQRATAADRRAAINAGFIERGIKAAAGEPVD